MTEHDSETAFVSKGNCGIPEFRGAEIHYSGTPELMARYVGLAVDAGARIVGGCCGTSPDHLAAMRVALDAALEDRALDGPGPRPTMESIVERSDRWRTPRRGATPHPARAASPAGSEPMTTGILTLSCPDRPGLVHAVSGYLVSVRANIVGERAVRGRRHAPLLHADPLRPARRCAPARRGAAWVRRRGRRVRHAWEIIDAATPARTLVLVSRLGHCLNDLLFRTRVGTLPITIPAVVSNHDDLAVGGRGARASRTTTSR